MGAEMIKDPDEVIEIVRVLNRDGLPFITVSTNALNARWVKALFERYAYPFRALRDMGFECVKHGRSP
jgi:hypothetical protein